MTRLPSTSLRSIVALALLALVAAAPARAQDGGGDGEVVLTAVAGEDLALSASETCDAMVTLDGSGSTVPEGVIATFTWTGGFPEGEGMVDGVQATVTLPLGVHEIVLTLSTEEGATSSDSLLVTVDDTTPPTINSILANPNHVWPPNHKMVPVEVLLDVTDNCDGDPVCQIVSIDSNEPENGRGDGNTSPDWRHTGDLSASIRAERSGRGSGRVYTIGVECSDSTGNTATATATVTVPHDRRRTKTTGNGEPQRQDATKIAFKVDFNNVERNRLVAKLDVSSTIDDLPSRDLENYDLIVEIGIEEVWGTFDAANRIRNEIDSTVQLRAKLTRSEFLIVDVRGLDLPDILFLDPSEDLRDAEIIVPITALVLPPDDGSGAPADPIILFEDLLETSYRQKAERKGRGKMRR